MFKRHKIGLALGAGGARGLAHIGVLKYMERAGLRIHCITGSSVGALVGGLYAHAGNTAQLEHMALDFIQTDGFARLGLGGLSGFMSGKPTHAPKRLKNFVQKVYLQARLVTHLAVIDHETMDQILAELVPDVLIEDLGLPFAAVATDLVSGRPVLFRRGPLRRAIRASMAIPGVIEPLALDDMLLVDGAVLNQVPVQPLAGLGATAAIAVDVEPDHRLANGPGFTRGLEILFRAEDIEGYVLKECQISGADLVLRPQVGHLHWSDFVRAAEIIQLGKQAGVARSQEITRLAKSRRLGPPALSRPPRLNMPWLEF